MFYSCLPSLEHSFTSSYRKVSFELEDYLFDLSSLTFYFLDHPALISCFMWSHLKNFYQGNADLSGSVDVPVCLPSNGQACPNFKTITINTTKCKVKVDSGVIVGAFSSSPTWTSGDNNYFIYPDNLGGGLSARITE